MIREEIEITIITVCYNSEKTIRKTIQSITSQLSQNVEYLIIDGNSSDNTLKIIQEEQETAPIRLISEPDQGIYDAMNKGMRLAFGKWLLYINSDDCLKDGVIERILPVLRETEADCVCTDVELCRKVDGEWYSRFWVAENVDFRVKRYMPCCHQGMYLKKDVLMEFGGFDCRFKIAADWDLVYRMYNEKKVFQILHILNAEFLEGGASNKWLVWEKHKIRKKNKGYYFLDWAMLRDLKNRIRSEIARLILGSRKEHIAIKKTYTKIEK